MNKEPSLKIYKKDEEILKIPSKPVTDTEFASREIADIAQALSLAKYAPSVLPRLKLAIPKEL